MHTKGPWRVVELSDATEVRFRSPIDDEWGMATIHGENSDANARLIAAAPEMLEALEHIATMPCILDLLGEVATDEHGNPIDCTCAGCVAKRTIRKAKGE